MRVSEDSLGHKNEELGMKMETTTIEVPRKGTVTEFSSGGTVVQEPATKGKGKQKGSMDPRERKRSKYEERDPPSKLASKGDQVWKASSSRY